MSTHSLPSAFQTAREFVESRIIDHPLNPWEPDHFTVLRRYHVHVDYYENFILNRYTPDTEFSNAYLMWQREERQIDKLLFFTRFYASIPDPWSKPGSTVVTIPGLNVTPTLETAQTITAFSLSSGFFKTSHGLSAGDNVHVSARIRRQAFNDTYTVAGSYIITSAATNTFKIPLTNLPTGTYTLDYGSVAEYSAGYPVSTPASRSVATRDVRTYYIPGVSTNENGNVVDSEKDIILSPPFTPIDDAGTNVDTLTADTTPPASEYWDMVEARADVLAGSVLEEPLYDGILVRRNTYWTATL